MLKCLCTVFEELIPFAWQPSPIAYAAKTLGSPEHQTFVTALRAAAKAASDAAILKEFRDVAKEMIDEEAARRAFIITRAQGLLVALALFGFLFTLGTSLFTQTSLFGKQLSWVFLIFVAFILLQMTVMVLNILRAIGGIEEPRVGASELTAWLGLSEPEFHRAQALLTLDHYRVAALNDNWRFAHLGRALKGMRNIVFALSALIFFLFVAGMVAPPPAPVAPTITVIEPPWHRHHWLR